MARTLIAALVAALLLPAAAAATQKPITGKLSKPGYTVIALGSSGRATTSHARAFKIAPRDSRVTLQLRDAKGRYAGPVVVAGTGSQVILGVKAGAKLGTVRVLAGYGKAAKALPKRAIDATRVAQAKKGVPLGNGRNLGLVRSGKRGSGGDQDLDGVPDALDVDRNGNLVLNNEERGAPARAAQVQPDAFSVFSQIGVRIDRSVNANAAGVSDADIDNLVQGNTTAPPYQPIGMFLDFHVATGDQVELDCGGLSYCTKGGTGRVRAPGGMDPGPSFPDCCDEDGDGFGALTSAPGPGGSSEAQLYPMATSSQIKSGDVLIERRTSGGVESELPGTLNFVFNTTPALTAWSSSAGQSGTVTYPVPAGGGGTQDNPFGVSQDGDGNVVVNMTFWRPQRRAIEGAGEAPGFIDIGHLLWQTRLVTQQTVVDCPGGMTDDAADAPANPANTLSMSLNFNACLASKGVTWNKGEAMQLEIVARSPTGGDNSAQQVFFRLQ